MNTGQLLLTTSAMVLLSLLILRVNNGFLTTNSVMMENKFGVLAISIGSSLLEEATGKAFDANTVENTVTSTSQLSTIGKAVGEVYPDFNDFDDYNNLTKVDSTLPSAVFNISCSVCYVNPSNPNVSTGSTKTWHKKLTVVVTSPSMTDTIRFSTVYSYFFYR
ncbi:MAG: hypothetical protein V1773_13605 [bacterium]